MNTPRPLTDILQDIAAIATMERGKLSIIREGATGPFYKLQAREHGKNATRYVPRAQVPHVQAAIEGYQRFQQLTQEYAGQVITRTRASLARSARFSGAKSSRSGVASP